MIEETQLEDIFARGGILDKGLENFEKRDDQLLMAQDVARCYNEDTVGVIEAGTGIGKSYAYLSVAILAALEDDDERTVVATSNVALQQQLINKDLPTLERLMEVDVPYALLLGRGRYVCFAKMTGAVNSYRQKTGDMLFKDEESDEERIYQWFRNTTTGIVEELEHRLLASPFIARVRSDKDTCMKQKCPHFTRCFYYNALQKARNSRIIVTNHALLFIDSSIRADAGEDYDESVIIPPYNRLVIDECHNIDRAATEFFSTYMDRKWILETHRRLFQVTHKARNGMTLADIVSALRKDAVVEDAGRFETLALQFNQESATLLGSILSDEDRMAFTSQCLIDDTRIPFDQGLCSRCASLSSTLEAFLKTFDFLLDVKDVAEEDEMYVRMATTIRDTYRSWKHLLDCFVDHASHPDLVFHYQWSTRGGDVAMVVSPLSVADRMREDIFDKLQSVVCTSATIKAGKDFSYFLSQIGLDGMEDLVTGFYSSPFDYSHNAMLLYPAREDGMNFNFSSRREYAHYLAQMIVDVVRSSEGGALVLFTSAEMMNLVYEEARDGITQTLLVQKRGTSTEKLRRQFCNDVGSVLFGLRSFWEGIDVPGESLKLLVITQLPFTHVEDPIRRSRSMALARDGKNPYMLIDLPEMLITLKQGIGRLIRSESDRGVVVIADARARRYIQLIRSCIPPYYVPDDEGLTVSSFAQRVEDFLFS